MQFYSAALAALGLFASAQGRAQAVAEAPVIVTQIHFAAAHHDGRVESLIDSNRSQLPLEAEHAGRFLETDAAHFDETIKGGMLSRHLGLDGQPEHLPMMQAPIFATTDEELDRFTLAGAGSLPEIGIDEEEVEPGDVMLAIGGMCAIAALIFRVHKGARLPKLAPLPRRSQWLKWSAWSAWSKHTKKRSTLMSDSDFYPI